MTETKPLPSIVRRRAQNPTLKLVLEMGPLVLFFLTNWKFGIFPATGVLMAGVVAALIASWVLTRHLPIMPVVTAVAVVFFGALTFFFHDDLFIKLKPTIVNTIFGTVLLGGLALGRPLLPVVLDSVLQLKEEGWRKLTFRWGLFFFVLAIINEIVWRTQTTDFWVSFKALGIMPLTIVFALAQVPLIMKYELKDEDAQNRDHW
ncbi:MAG: ispZ [Hyphomicrobiales bacterium]|jgi:intracellular septation protein|nr:ispZ [Hyphomicrobiales bacterium]